MGSWFLSEKALRLRIVSLKVYLESEAAQWVETRPALFSFLHPFPHEFAPLSWYICYYGTVP
jgi:hypothetical protein